MDFTNFSSAMEALHPFYSLLGEAAATLLGLLFVSVTFNPQILDSNSGPIQRRYAENIFRQFFFLVWLSLMMLLPMTPSELGWSVLIQSLFFLIWVLIGFYRSLGTPDFFKNRLMRQSYLFNFAIYAGAIWAGFTFVYAKPDQSYSFALLLSVSFLSLLSGLAGVWRLMVGSREPKPAASDSSPKASRKSLTRER
jgi:hypothetical protein